MVFASADILNALMGKFLVGTLLFMRVTALLFSGPVFSSMGIDPQVKVFLSAVVALSMTMVYGHAQPPLNLDAWAIVLIALKEIFIGSLLGYCASMILHAARFAGGILDVEIGFQTALMFDPSAGVPTLLGELKSMMMMMIFLLMNGHHYLLEAVFVSAEIIPIDSFTANKDLIDLIVRLVTSTMIIGVKIASPVLVSLFLTNLALSLLAKVAPQMNVFALSLHLKAIVGLIALFAVTPLIVLLLRNVMSLFQSDMMTVLKTIAPIH